MKTLKKVLISTLIGVVAVSPLAVYFLSGGQDINEIKELIGASISGFTIGGAGVGALVLISSKALTKVNKDFNTSTQALKLQEANVDKLIKLLVEDNNALKLEIVSLKNTIVDDVKKLQLEVQETNNKIKNGVLRIVESFNEEEKQEIIVDIKEV